MTIRTHTLRALSVGLTLGLALASNACVSQATFDEAVKNGEDARLQCARSSADQAKAWSARVDTLTATLAGDEARLGVAANRETELLHAVDAKAIEAETLRGELRRAGENEALYKSLAMRLKSVVDTGDLSIVLRAGRMVLRLPNDVLFDSGSTVIKPAGRKTLATIASALSTVPGRRFQVAGHTDNEPIHNERFASNWELSTGRAVEVVHFMVTSGGMKPTLLSAAGYGEFDPVAANAAAGDRARNRRIEITVMPEIREVPVVPDRY